jgi:prephenate dehydrogenase
MRITIIGTGLIGGSLALALKKNCGLKYQIYCYNRNIKTTEIALERNIVDQAFDDIKSAARESDVVIIASPLSSYKDIVAEVFKANPDSIISDVGSVKSRPSEEVIEILHERSLNFVPAHPIAGKENSGIEAACANLYEGKNVIITPFADSDDNNIKIISEIWLDAGAKIRFLTADEHDFIFAKVSHLPQKISFLMKEFYGKNGQVINLSNDFFRLTKSPENMWDEIFEYNSKFINSAKTKFFETLKTLAESYFAESVEYNSEHFFNDELPIIISKAFYNYASEAEKNFAGTGFKSLTKMKDGKLALSKKSVEMIYKLAATSSE